MAFVRVAQEQEQSLTIQSVYFPALLGSTQSAPCQENVSKTETGVVKISFVKVNESAVEFCRSPNARFAWG